MSDQEQDLLTGRLMSEIAERKRNIALLRIKLDGFAKAIDAAGIAVMSIWAHPELVNQEPAIGKLPNPTEVLATCAELRAESARYDVLKVQAAHLGL